MTPAQKLQAMRDLVIHLTTIHSDAHRLGLHRTGHALHEAVKVVGFEMAGMIEKESKS